MGDLQATLELFVELNKFYNVDLFQRGWVQSAANKPHIQEDRQVFLISLFWVSGSTLNEYWLKGVVIWLLGVARDRQSS
jgi:hypothetical protein